MNAIRTKRDVSLISFLIIFIKCIFAQNLLLPEFKDYNEIEKLSDKFQQIVFDGCFVDETKPILTAANWSNSHLKINWLLKSKFKSLLLFGVEKSDNLGNYEKQKKRYVFNVNSTFEKSWPISKIIIINYDVDSLKLILFKLKDTIFWNTSGLFFVRVASANSCKFAHEYLKIIWDFNILSAIILCHDLQYGVNVYTFNPYTKKATKFWTQIDDYKQQNGKTMAIFVNIRISSAACKEIWFDKTADLSDYTVPIAASNLILTTFAKTKSRVRKVDVFRAPRQTLSLALQYLGARPEFTFYDSTMEAGEIDGKGVGSGVIGKVLAGRYEACTAPDYQRGLWRSELPTYVPAGFCYVTRRERLGVGRRLLRAFPPEVLAVLQLLVLACVPPFRRSLGLRESSAAALEVLRAVLGVGTARRPRGRLGRVLVAGCVVSFLVVGAFLQSQLSTMLATVSSARTELRTAADLVRHGYKIHVRGYVWRNYWDISPLADTGPASSAEAFDHLTQCVARMHRDERIACVEDCQFARFFVHEDEDLRVSREEYFDTYKVLVLREDSPLRGRLESVYARLTQHGIAQQLRNLEALGYRRPRPVGFRCIDLRQLKYAFGLLTIGCAVGVLAFVGEIAKGYCDGRKAVVVSKR